MVGLGWLVWCGLLFVYWFSVGGGFGKIAVGVWYLRLVGVDIVLVLNSVACFVIMSLKCCLRYG